MSQGYDVHSGVTRGVGTSTAAAPAPLAALAGSMPEAPNAGVATGAAIAYLQALADSLEAVTRAAEQIGGQVGAAVDTYQSDDGQSSATINGVQVPTGAPGGPSGLSPSLGLGPR